MSLEQLTLSDEQVQDIVASLITSGDNADAVYDDANDTLTVSLSDSISVNTLEAETLLGADVLNASENQILVAQGDGTLSVETQAQGPNPYDQAQSFAESDLAVTTNNTTVSNGVIEIASETATTPDDNSDATTSTKDGVLINPNVSASEVKAVISQNMIGATTAYLVQDSDGAQLDTTDISTLSSGDEFSLSASINSGQDYRLLLDADGSDYTRGIASTNFPATSANVDIVSGYFDGGANDNVSINIKSVTVGNPPTSGNALIEWDRGIPTDIFEWDVATFTESPDGEAVDVFVAYSADGGSTWQRTNSGDPITRNYSLNEDANITSDVDVRIETELSRADTANNPKLDSAYRSWLV